MAKFYSPSNRGCLDSEMQMNCMPTDCIPISEEQFQDFITIRDGYILTHDGVNLPRFQKLSEYYPDYINIQRQLWREQRNHYLLQTDGIVERHRDQKDLGGLTSLTDQQYKEVLLYRQFLRDWPTSTDFYKGILPQQPDFLVLNPLPN